MARATSATLGATLVLVLAAETRAQRASEGGSASEDESATVTVRGRVPPRSAGDYTLDVQPLRAVPRGGAAEFLMLAPGVVLSQHSGEGKAHQLFLRGFDAQHGQDVEFNVGGMPINDVSNVHGQGYADLNFLIPEVVDRVRVLEGPYDPRQGDFAVAGSARFELGVAERGAWARVGYGMSTTARGVFVLAPRGLDRGTFLAGELGRSDGYGQQRSWARAAAIGQWVQRLGSRWTLRVLAQTYVGQWDTAGVVSETDYFSGAQGFYDTNDPRQGGTGSRHGGAVELTYAEGADRIEMLLFGAARALRIRENYTGYLLDPRGDRFEQNYRAGVFGLRGSWRHSFGPVATELGVHGRYDATTQSMYRLGFNNDAVYRTDVDADVGAVDLGLYADVEANLFNRRLRLRGGLRADALFFQIDDRLPRESRGAVAPVPRGRREAQGFAFGPRATVEVALTRALSVLAAYGRGFRSAQALSLGQGESAPFAVVDSGELGVQYRVSGGEFSASGFLTHVDRDLVFDPVAGQNLALPESAATLRMGLAAHVRVAPVEGLTVMASGTWSRASFDATGLLVPYVPSLVGRLDVAFDRIVATVARRPFGVQAGLGATVLGTRPLPYGERADAVGLLDLGAGVRWWLFELNASLRNATNAQWRDGQFDYASNFDPSRTASLVPVRHFTAGRPLTFMATLGARW